jgi:ABC-type Mn2+/Zn2+ transport system permease subunit
MIGRLLHPFEFFAASYLATLLVAVGCAYLGVFVALRRVVFLGVALAELSAAGIATALLLASLVPGLSEGAGADWLALAGSVVFSLLGVAVLAAPFAEKRISRESVVAVGYAAGAAGAVLLVWKSAQDLEHVKNILAGSSLYVSQGQLVTIAVAFAVIGVVHALLRKEFVFCSFDPAMARTLGIPARPIELALYATIGLAIALALRTLGVLSVFGFLVVPALEGLLLARRFAPAFWHAVAQAAIGSALGLLVADLLDLPPGPATVAVLLAMIAPAALASRWETFRKLWMVLEAAGAIAALGLAGVSIHALVHEEHAIAPVVAHAHHTAEPPRHEDRGTLAGTVHHAIEEIQKGDEHGVDELIDVLGSEAPPFDRSEALDALAHMARGDLGYDPDKDAAGNADSLRLWREWRSKVKGRLKFNAETKTFDAPG